VRPKHLSLTSRDLLDSDIISTLYNYFGFVPWGLIVPSGDQWSFSFGVEPLRWGWGSGIAYWAQPSLWNAGSGYPVSAFPTSQTPFLSYYLGKKLGMEF
jgi:hypothetical protein